MKTLTMNYVQPKKACSWLETPSLTGGGFLLSKLLAVTALIR
jgi:hypothetical protein